MSVESFRQYYRLTKPGIVYGNALTIVAGFLLGSSTVTFHVWSFLAVLIGTSIVIASACVVNNVIDRDIDRKMTRTKKRALVVGTISPKAAIIYGAILGIIGFTILLIWTNFLTFGLGMIAYIFYVVFYGISKRKSEHGTLVGSVSGALPPIAGYTAATNRLDIGVVIMFFIMVFWQMAHFFAIAIYRRKEYAKAGIPVLTVVRGNVAARLQISIYIIGFILAIVELALAGYVGIIYVVVIVPVSIVWFIKSLKNINSPDEKLQDSIARKLFGFSLLVNIVMCVMISVGGYLP